MIRFVPASEGVRSQELRESGDAFDGLVSRIAPQYAFDFCGKAGMKDFDGLTQMGTNLGESFDADWQKGEFVPAGAECVPAEIPTPGPMEIGAVVLLKRVQLAILPGFSRVFVLNGGLFRGFLAKGAA